jgi:hypothetical protein
MVALLALPIFDLLVLASPFGYLEFAAEDFAFSHLDIFAFTAWKLHYTKVMSPGVRVVYVYDDFQPLATYQAFPYDITFRDAFTPPLVLHRALIPVRLFNSKPG